MSPELNAVMQAIATLLVQKPAEVQLFASLAKLNPDAVSTLLKEAGDIAASTDSDEVATSAILQKVLAKRAELMPQRVTTVEYFECPHCECITKQER